MCVSIWCVVWKWATTRLSGICVAITARSSAGIPKPQTYPFHGSYFGRSKQVVSKYELMSSRTGSLTSPVYTLYTVHFILELFSLLSDMFELVINTLHLPVGDMTATCNLLRIPLPLRLPNIRQFWLGSSVINCLFIWSHSPVVLVGLLGFTSQFNVVKSRTVTCLICRCFIFWSRGQYLSNFSNEFVAAGSTDDSHSFA